MTMDRTEVEAVAREGLQRILDMGCPLGREGDLLGEAQKIASETITKLAALDAARSPTDMTERELEDAAQWYGDTRPPASARSLQGCAHEHCFVPDTRCVMGLDENSCPHRSPQDEDHEAGIPEAALDAAEAAVHACRRYALGHPSRKAIYVEARDEAYDVLKAALPYLSRCPSPERDTESRFPQGMTSDEVNLYAQLTDAQTELETVRWGMEREMQRADRAEHVLRVVADEIASRPERWAKPAPGMLWLVVHRAYDVLADRNAASVAHLKPTEPSPERDHEAVWRSMLDRIRIHGASGVWNGESCAIGAIAALDGEDAARAFMAERDVAPSPERNTERLVEALRGLVECFDGFDNEADGAVMNGTMVWEDVIPRIERAREALAEFDTSKEA